MTIETYAKQIGITANAEQLTKLQEYMQHKPKVGEVYLLPCKITGISVNWHMVDAEVGGITYYLSSLNFTPDRLESNQPQGLTAKFKVGQKVRIRGSSTVHEIRQIFSYYRIDAELTKWFDDELEAVED